MNESAAIWIGVVIGYAFTMGYSIFMAYIGWKQAKVLETLKETNQILEKILIQIKGSDKK